MASLVKQRMENEHTVEKTTTTTTFNPPGLSD